jgi:subtilisin family serine protease
MITTLLLTTALATTLDADLRALAAIAGEPSHVSAAGITRDEAPILTIENGDAFDLASTKRRLVLIGSPDGDARSVDAVVAAVRWFKTRASASIRREWTVSALPSAQLDANDKLSLARWVTFQAADLVVTVGDTATNTISGTSMATPHVTGVVTRFLQANPGATPAQARNEIVNQATLNHLSGIPTGTANRLLFWSSAR